MRGPTVSVRSCRRSARDELGLRVAELSHRKRVPGVRLVWLFHVAPTPVQRALVARAPAEKAR